MNATASTRTGRPLARLLGANVFLVSAHYNLGDLAFPRPGYRHELLLGKIEAACLEELHTLSMVLLDYDLVRPSRH